MSIIDKITAVFIGLLVLAFIAFPWVLLWYTAGWRP